MIINTLKKKVLTFTMAGVLTFSSLPAYAALGDTTLKKGMRHDDIKVMQQLLKDSGYFRNSDTTTYFGDVTLKAVLEFQKSQNLKQDGIFGPATYQALMNLSGKKGVAPSRGDSGSRSQTISIITTAKRYLGVPYVFGGSTTKGFDCSGYTQYVFKQNGISIPRSTVDQAKVGAKISRANLQVGDLIIFSNTYKNGPSHAGIYLGDGKFIHASSAGKGVIISDLNSSYYSSHFSWGQRVY